jgi:hypothetical protein
MKKSISIVLLATILLQSCAAYQKTSVPIHQTVGRGEVKVKYNTGKEYKFKNIKLVDGEYYGVRSGFSSSEHLMKIDNTISSFYLKESVFRVWITLKDNTQIKGVLYEVSDSSIWVAASIGVYPNKRKNYESYGYKKTEYSISHIQSINTRSLGKVGRGAGVGAAIPIALAPLIFLAGDEAPYAALLIVPFAILGVTLGAVMASPKEGFYISGSLERYKSYQQKLRKYSIK